MKSLKVNVVNHKGMTLEVNLHSKDNEGFTFGFDFKDANGAPLTEFDSEADDFFGTMTLLVNHVNAIADFLDGQSDDRGSDANTVDTVDMGVIN